MLKLKFCQINAVGSLGCEVLTISPSKSYGTPNNIHNAKTMIRATAEYLNAILNLQKKVKEKYECQLMANTRVKAEDLNDRFDLVKELENLRKPGTDGLYDQKCIGYV